MEVGWGMGLMRDAEADVLPGELRNLLVPCALIFHFGKISGAETSYHLQCLKH